MDSASEHDRICLGLASALCARLCHDISSPLGTLAGTLELAAEDAESSEEALLIAGEAAASLINRLQLLRAAWAGDCGPMSKQRIAELATGLPERVKVSVDELDAGQLNGAVARIVLNLLLLGADALPAGGLITVAGDALSGIIVTVEGPSVAWNAALGAALLDPASLPAPEPRTVQMPLTTRLVREAGMRLSFLMAVTHGPRSAPRLLLAPG